MENVSIPSSVTYIGANAFQSCSSLKKIAIPFQVKKINENLCYKCKSLRQISIPSSMKSIKDSAFFGCDSLKQIPIPNSVISIGTNALNDNDDDECFSFVGLFYYVIVLGSISIFLLMIFSINWWLLIHPWFVHGYKSGKKVYQLIEICMISSISYMVILILYLLLYMLFIRKTKKIKRLKRIGISIHYIATILLISLCLISIIIGIIVSFYGRKKEVIEGKSIKCMRNIFEGCQGAENWVAKQSLKKQNEYKQWYNEMIINSHDENGVINDYYCHQANKVLGFSLVIPCLVGLTLVVIMITELNMKLKEYCHN